VFILLRAILWVLCCYPRAREEDAADREADLVRERLLQGRQRDVDEPDRPLRPAEKGFRCRPAVALDRLVCIQIQNCAHIPAADMARSTKRQAVNLDACVPLQVQRSRAREGKAELQARPSFSDCAGSQCRPARQVEWHAVRPHDEEGVRPQRCAAVCSPARVWSARSCVPAYELLG
jgi:hypothetical protein